MTDIPHAINVYTDGSYKKGDGGSGLLIIYPDGTEESPAIIGRTNTTNNRSELRAVIEAFKMIQKTTHARGHNFVAIHTDSQYIIDNYKKVVGGSWYGEPWKTHDGTDFANKDLWQEFTREFKKTRKRIELYKVKAHSGNAGNETADRLAKKSRQGVKKKDLGAPKGVARGWLNIKENKVDEILSPVLTVYVQNSRSRNTSFTANVQIIRPKKYFGRKTIIIGILGKHAFHVGHIHIIKIEMDKLPKLFVDEIIEDIGRPNDNKHLWFMEKN